MMFTRQDLPTRCMVTFDALIDKLDRYAMIAEELGLEEDASHTAKETACTKSWKTTLSELAKKTSRQTIQAK